MYFYYCYFLSLEVNKMQETVSPAFGFEILLVF